MRSDETCHMSMSSVNIRRRRDLSLQKKGSWLVKNLRVRAVLELRRAGNDESASQRKKNKWSKEQAFSAALLSSFLIWATLLRSSAPQQLFSDVILSNHLRLPSPQQPYFTRNLQQPSSAAFLGLPSIGGQLFHIISRSSYMATFLWKNPFAALSGKGRPWKNSTVAFWSLTILPRIKHFDSLKSLRVSSPSLDTSACQP